MSRTRRQRWAHGLGVGAGLLLPGGMVLGSTAPAGDRIDYRRDVRPVLAANCFACHGADAGSRQAQLRLDTREGAIAARSGMPAVDPGKPEHSSLVARINAVDARVMPPASTGHHLTPEQKRLLTEWVRQGAPYAQHWSFAPLVRPAVPRIPSGAPARNPIDAFVLARLANEGLQASPEADPATLIRRVTLDLTGLPPTPEEVDAFLRESESERPKLSPRTDKSGQNRTSVTSPTPYTLRPTPYPAAYERLVDRLLASPRYGEHWARMWLDLARYADTQGYEKDLPRTIWRYRDWVIDAFNADMPYDRFTIEQLAGDLLPNPTPGQLLATAFHRNTMTNTEGGVDPEEFRVTAVRDRVETTVQVWMGLTMGCARCHTHKYDPIANQDYYRFYALFNQTEDFNRGDESPTAPMPTAEQQQRLAALDEKLKGLRERFWQPLPELVEQQVSWERELAAHGQWTPLRFTSATSDGNAQFKLRADGAVLASGPHADRDTYTVTLPLPEGPVRTLRLEALKDPSQPKGGPGRDEGDQNVVTSELSVELVNGDGTKPLKLANARADFEQGGWPAKSAIDGNPGTGWAWAPQNGQPHVLLIDFAEPLEAPGASGGKLVVRIRQDFPRLQHGAFRLSVSGSDPAQLKAELHPLSEVAAVPREQRSAADQKRLDEAFRQNFVPTSLVYGDLKQAEQERAELEKAIPKIPVLRELPQERQRTTKIHQRGNFLDPGETVAPAVLPAFGTLPAGTPLNRLGAAQWLVSKDNPLTARVAVNRIWARLFGTGLVETEEDFGAQGSPPSHPELLDWLASVYSQPAASNGNDREKERLRDRETGLTRTVSSSGGDGEKERGRDRGTETPDGLGWSTKQLIKLIVMSSTYRQYSSQAPIPSPSPNPGGRERSSLTAARPNTQHLTPNTGPALDPHNRLLWRGPRVRLSGEVLRDQALAVSGLLSAKLHGPSVMPPQPDGLWKTVYSGLKWQTSPGEDRYRRSLYTFWRRTSPYPSLTTFDAGSGEFCVIRRIRTNTPLQALVTLNDPVFVEAAGALGKRMLESAGSGPRAALEHGFRRVLARQPAPAELARLARLYDATLAAYREKPEDARALLAAANTPPLPDRDPAEQAAFTAVANVLLNLDETVTKP